MNCTLRSSASKNSLKYWLISDGVMVSLFSGFISWFMVVSPCFGVVSSDTSGFLLVGFRVLLCFQSAFRMKRLGGVYNYAKGLYDSSPTMSVLGYVGRADYAMSNLRRTRLRASTSWSKERRLTVRMCTWVTDVGVSRRVSKVTSAQS